MERGRNHSRNLGLQRPRRPFSSSSTNLPSKPMKSSHNNEENDQTSKASEAPSTDSSIVGTCLDMCPAKERSQRERLRDLSVFERLNGIPGKTSAKLAVKKFCRTISTMDTQPSDVRPLQVLQDTLTYLLSLLDSSEHPFELVHDFIFDRTRAIRQDLSMQNIVNDQVVHMYEEMVKFHIMSHHKLPRCSDSTYISSVYHLNMEQLLKSLTSLYNLYDANRRSNSANKNEAEFYSYYILLHLGSKSYQTGESLSLWFRGLDTSIIKSKEMSFARRVLRFFRMCDYNRFFSTTAAEASYLQYCLMESLINEVRVRAISYINNGGYKLHPYPLAHLSKLLMMEELDMESLCNECGLEVRTDEAGNKLLATKQTSFSQPKGGLKNYGFLGLERIQRCYLVPGRFNPCYGTPNRHCSLQPCFTPPPPLATGKQHAIPHVPCPSKLLNIIRC